MVAFAIDRIGKPFEAMIDARHAVAVGDRVGFVLDRREVFVFPAPARRQSAGTRPEWRADFTAAAAPSDTPEWDH